MFTSRKAARAAKRDAALKVAVAAAARHLPDVHAADVAARRLAAQRAAQARFDAALGLEAKS